MFQRRAITVGGVLASLLLAACGPTAQPTATQSAQSTATRAAATATRPAGTVPAGATATVAETKVRPVPVVGMPAANPLAQKGGIYRSLTTDEPPDFGIWDSAVGSTFQVSIPATDSLLDRNEYEPNKISQILSNVAYDWWTDQSGEQWTFKLKEGIKFHDGKPFTCADAEFSLETLRDARDATGATLRRSPRGSFLRRVKDFSCPDAYTLKVVTDKPLPSLPATIAMTSFALMPKHIYEANLDKVWKEPMKVGMGPYEFVSHTPTESVRFKRNANYWNQPYPYLDGYWVMNAGSATAAQAAFRVGRGEGGVSFPATTRKQLETEGKLYVATPGLTDGFAGYQANFTRKPWSDPRFSLAMRCAIDSKKLIAIAVNGDGYEGPIFPLTKDPGGSEWAITEEEWKAVHPCHGPSGDAANMEKRWEIARGLMKELGFGPDNPAKPTTYRVGDDPSLTSILDDWSKVYIQAQVRAVTTSQRYDIQTNAEADILQQGFETSRRDPDHWLYEHYYSTSDRNYGRYSNAEADALIDKQSRTLDQVERRKIINQLEKMLLKDNAKIVVRHTILPRTFAPWVKDMFWGMPGNSQNTSVKFVRVWIDQEVFKKMGSS